VPSGGGIEYLLLTGRGLVLFDGLDELIEISKRRAMVNRIENFCNLFSTSIALVTSRSIGYAEAPLDVKSFATHALEGFTESDVELYVRAWFAVHDMGAGGDVEDLVAHFLEESRSVPDLRSNPLMLGPALQRLSAPTLHSAESI
jgi:predicted NACHT family NTPase